MSGGNGVRVLYMEDDPVSARMVRRTLERVGYAVTVARDGTEGLAMYAGDAYDIVVMDQQMPGCDGLDVVRALADRGPLPPVIMVTATGNEQIATEAMKMGIGDYLVKDPEGEHFRLLPAVIERVLDQHRLAGEKRRAEETLRIRDWAINSSVSAIAFADLDGCLTYVNPSFLRLWGYEDENEVTGRMLAAFWHQEAAVAEIMDALCNGGSWTGERVARRRDESPFEVYCSANIVTDEAGGPLCIMCSCTDITKRKLLENQLAQAQKLEAIGQLAAGIAHEINTPTQYVGDNTRFLKESFGELSGLLAQYGQLLEATEAGAVSSEVVAEVKDAVEEVDVDYLMEEIPEAIEQSLEGIGRVSEIVQAMREFSHPGGEEKSAIDLNRAIESTITVARNEWKYVADMETDLDDALPLVWCLPGELNQVILNLLLNATHAIGDVVGDGSGGKGLIRVSTRVDGEWVEIRIGDSGTGISEDARDRVFDPFFTTKEVGKGTGQGLAIAHNVVVEKHGGMISFETEMGRGTTFILKLPARDVSRKKDES